MPRLFTRAQQAQNDAFLLALRRTGNARLAAREIGVHRSTYLKRRARSAAFATEWDGALAAAHAAFHLSGGPRPPEARPAQSRRSGAGPAEAAPQAPSEAGPPAAALPSTRTRGGEPTIVRTASGRLQLRRAPPGRMTRDSERAFLAALSATANVRLSAAAAGFAHASFYARRRRSVAFEAEHGTALRIGYDRLEHAVLERTLEALGDPGAPALDSGPAVSWSLNPLPPLSFDQAFQVLCQHRAAVRFGEGRRLRLYDGASGLAPALAALSRNIHALERAARYQETGAWRHPHEPAPPPPLPPLDLVSGWSAATGRRPGRRCLALFGGWRIEDLRRAARTP